jgi:hypothetical protein
MGAQKAKSVIAFVRWWVGYQITGAKEKDLFFTAIVLSAIRLRVFRIVAKVIV